MVSEWMAGNWKQLIAPMQEKWGKLSHNDLVVVAGERDRLIGLLQDHYSYPRSRAEMEVDEFTRTQKAQVETDVVECPSTLKP